MSDQNWKLSLKAWEFVLLLICILLALFLAYFFGFRAGQAVGYDDAMTKAIKNTPRLSVFEDAPASLEDEELDNLYKKVAENKANQESESKESDSENLEVTPEPTPAEEVEPDLAPLAEEFQKEQAEAQEPLDPEPSPTTGSVANELQQLAESEVLIENTTTQPVTEQEIKPIENGAILPVDESNDLPPQEVIPVTKPIEQHKAELIKEELAKEEAALKPKPTAEPTPPVKIQTSFAKGWYVQVATSKTMDAAEQISSKLYNAGFKARIDTMTIANQQFYRVLVGPETQKSYAERLVEQLSRERFISGKPFIRQIQ